MSFQLKEYQKHVLQQLQDFLRLARIGDPVAAYQQVIANNQSDDNGYENNYADRYHPIVEQLDCPHVCIRVPTAGGKTYLAAHAIGYGATYMETEKPTVLWFTPTDKIRSQTAAMLENRNHPCRIAIENRFGFDVVVYDIADFDVIRPQDFSERVCIIVSTAQMFLRKETTRQNDDGMTKATRRIYATHENFEPHFERLLPSPAPKSLERDEKGEIKQSFANLLHLVRPLVILDEAHRFVSELSHEVLRRINPACVLEWTATPRGKPSDPQPLHNVLVNIPAQALYDEQMVKLPIVVTEHGGWERAIVGAISEQKRLAKIAADNDQSIRPIVLYQAQDRDGEVTVGKLKEHLTQAHNIAADAIAIHTGNIKELDAAGDLLSTDCKIEHVITVKALVEGWDCPFAYILCTVSNVASDTAIEQLLGRIMRMPNARHRAQEDLNRAYAHVPETIPFTAAACLREKLADGLGFEEKEVNWAVQENLLLDNDDDGVLLAVNDIDIETVEPPNFAALPEETRMLVDVAVHISEADSAWKVVVTQPIPPTAQEIIIAAVAEEKRASERRRLSVENQRLCVARSPAHRGEKFALLPTLFFDSPAQEKQVVVNHDTLYEVAQWNDLDDNCLIDNFSIAETAQTIEISLEEGKVVYGKGEQYQMPLVDAEGADSRRYLAFWLEKKIRDPHGRYFPETLKKLIKTNLDKFIGEYSLETLIRAKYQFAEALKTQLSQHAKEIEERTFNEYLFDKSIQCKPFFEFPPLGYKAGNNVYSGNFSFQKHYYSSIGDLQSVGEEFECARIIDSSEHVRYWIRNLPKTDNSYSIPVSVSRNFYPDFVVLLTNAKVLIVEYKGGHLADSHANSPKNRMGEFIERHADNCFFLMATKGENKPDIEVQISDKIDTILEC